MQSSLSLKKGKTKRTPSETDINLARYYWGIEPLNPHQGKRVPRDREGYSLLWFDKEECAQLKSGE